MKRREGRDVAREILNLVNDFGFDRNGFAEEVMKSHRTLQQSVFELFLLMVKQWAEKAENGSYDLRNEYTCQTSKKIMDLLEGIWSVPCI